MRSGTGHSIGLATKPVGRRQSSVGAPPESDGSDRYLDDPESGDRCYGPSDDLQAYTRPTVPIEWTRFADDHRVAYETPPLDESLVVAGQGHVDLWLQVGSIDTAVQATITEIRSDGTEQRVQCGWHRPVHRVEDSDRSDHLRVDYTFTAEDREALDPGEVLNFRLPLMPFTHVFRAGSRLRVAVSTPGRDMPMWNFENPISEGSSHAVLRGGERASRLVLPIWPDGPDAPEPAAAEALRGQPHRPAEPIHNREG